MRRAGRRAGRGRVGVVAQVRRPGDLGPGRLDEGAEHDVVGVDDLAVLEGRSRRDELVAGGHHGDPRARVHEHLGDVRRGREREVPRPSRAPGAQDAVAGPDVLTPAAHVAVRAAARRAAPPRATPPSVSSTGTTASAPSGIGAPVMIRMTCPRRSTCRVVSPAATSPSTGRTTGRSGLAPASSAARTAYPSIAELSKPGQVDRGDDVLGEHEAQRRPDRDGHRRQRRDEREDGRAVLLDRAHQTAPSRCAPSGMVRTPPVTRTSPVHTTPAPKVASASTRRLEQPRIEGTPRGKRASKPSTSL